MNNKFFSDDQINILKNKGLKDKDINRLSKTINRYHSREGCKDIASEEVLEVENLKELLNKNERYGITEWYLLKELILDKLDNGNKKDDLKHKGFYYRTPYVNSIDYWSMGGTFHYRTYLYSDVLKIYFLDEFLRIIDVKNIEIRNIKGAVIRNKFKSNGKTTEMWYEVIKYIDAKIEKHIYMFSVEECIESNIIEFHKHLRLLGIDKFNLRDDNKKALNKIKLVEIGSIILCIVVGVLSIMNNR